MVGGGEPKPLNCSAAPLIKELRQVRADFTQLETEYNDKKKTYENTAVGDEAATPVLFTL